MRILTLQGPNLNLIGVRSAQLGERITLDKINTRLRRRARRLEVELKILQTQKIDRALAFLQRNRNWADGALVAPMAWARYEYTLKDTLTLIKIPTVQVLFKDQYQSGIDPAVSILTEGTLATVEDDPAAAFILALERLVDHLQRPK